MKTVKQEVAREADLTRVIRQLLRELKRQVLGNVSATVSVDYDDTTLDGLNVIAMAKVPSLVLSGPTLRPNRFYSANVAHEDVVGGVSGPELVRRKPPYTVDLVFSLTAASERTAELFNLMAAVATFLNRNRWIELQRDPSDAARGTVRWELDADGEFRTQLAGKDDVRAFTCGFVVRGFDVDEGLPLDLGKRVTEPELLPAQAIATGGKTVELHVTTGMTMTTHWAEHAPEDDEESDIIIAGRQVPFVQVGMIVHPDDCLNCERDGSPLWCSALVCDIHDDDETARFGMMATLLFRNGERREEPCDELRRRWRLARDFDQGRVYTGRWGTIPRGSVWPVAEVNEDA